MTARDAAEVMATDGGMGTANVTYVLRALAAAAADGPLTAEVECPRCWGKPAADVMPCGVCGDTGTVRVVVHLVGVNPFPNIPPGREVRA